MLKSLEKSALCNEVREQHLYLRDFLPIGSSRVDPDESLAVRHSVCKGSPASFLPPSGMSAASTQTPRREVQSGGQLTRAVRSAVPLGERAWRLL